MFCCRIFAGAIVIDYPDYPSLHKRHLYFLIGRKTENSVCPGRALTGAGLSCTTFESGSEVLDALTTKTPDVLLSETDGAIVIDYPDYPSLHKRHLYFLIGRKTENSVCP
jgi:hypothetical protein